MDPGKRFVEENLVCATAGTAAATSESGWSNTDVLLGYLENHFLHYFQGNEDRGTSIWWQDGIYVHHTEATIVISDGKILFI